jgi:hypothetical protein
MKLTRQSPWKPLGLAVFLVPFVAVSLGFFAYACLHLVTAVRLARHAPAAAVGPTRLAGNAGRPATLARAPSGKEGAGWLAWIVEEGRDSDGDPTHTIVCARGELTGVPIGGTSTPARLDWVGTTDLVDPAFGNALEVASLSKQPLLKLGARRHAGDGAVKEIPEPMVDLCRRALEGRAPKDLAYGEDVLPVGGAITIVACRTGGAEARLVPCGDGVDAVGVGALEGRSGSENFALPFGEVWTLLTVTFLGFLATGRVVRLRRPAA